MNVYREGHLIRREWLIGLKVVMIAAAFYLISMGLTGIMALLLMAFWLIHGLDSAMTSKKENNKGFFTFDLLYIAAAGILFVWMGVDFWYA